MRPVTALAGALGFIERVIRTGEKNFRLAAVGRREGAPNTQPDPYGGAHLKVERYRNLLNGPLCQIGGFDLGCAGQQDDEFVTSDAKDHIPRPESALQSFGHLAQQYVADRVAEAVIDVFEASRSMLRTANGLPPFAAGAASSLHMSRSFS